MFQLPTGIGIPQLFDVIVYIHGGAFTYGGGHLYKPKYLLDRDVVFVTVNYRLGPLGKKIWCTGDIINRLKQSLVVSSISRPIRVLTVTMRKELSYTVLPSIFRNNSTILR